MTKKIYDYLFVAAMVALAAYVGLAAWRYPRADIEEGYGPGIYPLLLAAALFLLAMLQLVITIRRKDDGKIEELSLASLKSPAAFWVLLVLFCLALKPLGLLLSGFLFLLVTCRFLFRVRWRGTLITAVVVPAAVWATFHLAMQVPLPTGTVWNLFR